MAVKIVEVNVVEEPRSTFLVFDEGRVMHLSVDVLVRHTRDSFTFRDNSRVYNKKSKKEEKE